MHRGWEHRSCHYVEVEYAIQAFPGFARGDGKWREEIYWATKTHSSRVFIPVYVFTAICLFFGFGHHIFGVDGGEDSFVFKGLAFLGLFASYFGISRHLKNRRPITPWDTAEYSGDRSV